MKRAEGELAEHIKAEFARQIRQLQAQLEAWIEPSGWLTGPGFGIADIAAGTVVHRSAYFGFPPVKGSKLEVWLDKVRERPSMKATLKEFDDKAPGMKDLAPVFLSGKMKREYRDHRLEFLIKSGGLPIVLEGLENDNIRFAWPDGQR